MGTIIPVEVRGDLPEGWTPVQVVSVIKCFDDEGELALAIRTSEGLTPWESVGMLMAASDGARTSLTGQSKNLEEGD